MRLWPKKSEKPAAGAVQLREAGRHPFGMLEGYVPLSRGDIAVYRAIREAVPVVDAAIVKLVRLCGGVLVKCRDGRAQEELERLNSDAYQEAAAKALYQAIVTTLEE